MASPAVPINESPPSRPNRATRRRAPKIERAYVGVAEAATSLDITEKTVRKMIALGELPARRINPRIIRIRIADLESLGERIGGGAA